MEKRVDFVQLFYHLERRELEHAKALVTSHNVQDRDARGYDVLCYVCEYGSDDPDLLRHFMKLGVSPIHEQTIGKRSQSVHSAAATNKPKMLRVLLDEAQTRNHLGSSESIFSPLDFAIGLSCGIKQQYRETKLVCAKMLLDAGARTTDMPEWVYAYLVRRACARAATKAFLQVAKRGSRVLIDTCNGKDVLRLVARYVWSMRDDARWDKTVAKLQKKLYWRRQELKCDDQ